MKSTGNISSLPRQLRPKPNSRLENGGQSGALIRQFISVPAVRFLLQPILGRRRVAKQNLFNWKPGAILYRQRSRLSGNPIRPLLEITINLNSAADFHHIPISLAFVATGGNSAVKLAHFLTDAEKSSSTDPPTLKQSDRIQPNPAESG